MSLGLESASCGLAMLLDFAHLICVVPVTQIHRPRTPSLHSMEPWWGLKLSVRLSSRHGLSTGCAFGWRTLARTAEFAMPLG